MGVCLVFECVLIIDVGWMFVLNLWVDDGDEISFGLVGVCIV